MVVTPSLPLFPASFHTTLESLLAMATWAALNSLLDMGRPPKADSLSPGTALAMSSNVREGIPPSRSWPFTPTSRKPASSSKRRTRAGLLHVCRVGGGGGWCWHRQKQQRVGYGEHLLRVAAVSRQEKVLVQVVKTAWCSTYAREGALIRRVSFARAATHPCRSGFKEVQRVPHVREITSKSCS